MEYRLCSIDNCLRDTKQYKVFLHNEIYYCNMHYQRLLRLGSTELKLKIAKPLKAEKTKRYHHKDGYVVVSDPKKRNKDNSILEHRLIMEQHLGRELLPDENVHHINGIKDDNRLENLELWSTHQPKGQRVEDKLQWAYEIIKLYGGEIN